MRSKMAKLHEWLSEHQPAEVGLAEFETLLRLLAPITESDLRHLLRETEAPLHPLAAGVDQTTFATLRDTLLALSTCYESGEAEPRRIARAIVITAKDHAKLALRNPHFPPAKQAQKAEMVTWLLTWLENPLVFPLWVGLRAKARGLD